tara:strand:- start:288 stop:5183 length:4896 start_codon:yes stop_codon:yes gene_type:complete
MHTHPSSPDHDARDEGIEEMFQYFKEKEINEFELLLENLTADETHLLYQLIKKNHFQGIEIDDRQLLPFLRPFLITLPIKDYIKMLQDYNEFIAHITNIKIYESVLSLYADIRKEKTMKDQLGIKDEEGYFTNISERYENIRHDMYWNKECLKEFEKGPKSQHAYLMKILHEKKYKTLMITRLEEGGQDKGPYLSMNKNGNQLTLENLPRSEYYIIIYELYYRSRAEDTLLNTKIFVEDYVNNPLFFSQTYHGIMYDKYLRTFIIKSIFWQYYRVNAKNKYFIVRIKQDVRIKQERDKDEILEEELDKDEILEEELDEEIDGMGIEIQRAEEIDGMGIEIQRAKESILDNLPEDCNWYLTFKHYFQSFIKIKNGTNNNISGVLACDSVTDGVDVTILIVFPDNKFLEKLEVINTNDLLSLINDIRQGGDLEGIVNISMSDIRQEGDLEGIVNISMNNQGGGGLTNPQIKNRDELINMLKSKPLDKFIENNDDHNRILLQEITKHCDAIHDFTEERIKAKSPHALKVVSKKFKSDILPEIRQLKQVKIIEAYNVWQQLAVTAAPGAVMAWSPASPPNPNYLDSLLKILKIVDPGFINNPANPLVFNPLSDPFKGSSAFTEDYFTQPLIKNIVHQEVDISNSKNLQNKMCENFLNSHPNTVTIGANIHTVKKKWSENKIQNSPADTETLQKTIMEHPANSTELSNINDIRAEMQEEIDTNIYQSVQSDADPDQITSLLLPPKPSGATWIRFNKLASLPDCIDAAGSSYISDNKLNPPNNYNHFIDDSITLCSTCHQQHINPDHRLMTNDVCNYSKYFEPFCNEFNIDIVFYLTRDSVKLKSHATMIISTRHPPTAHTSFSYPLARINLDVNSPFAVNNLKYIMLYAANKATPSAQRAVDLMAFKTIPGTAGWKTRTDKLEEIYKAVKERCDKDPEVNNWYEFFLTLKLIGDHGQANFVKSFETAGSATAVAAVAAVGKPILITRDRMLFYYALVSKIPSIFEGTDTAYIKTYPQVSDYHSTQYTRILGDEIITTNQMLQGLLSQVLGQPHPYNIFEGGVNLPSTLLPPSQKPLLPTPTFISQAVNETDINEYKRALIFLFAKVLMDQHKEAETKAAAETIAEGESPKEPESLLQECYTNYNEKKVYLRDDVIQYYSEVGVDDINSIISNYSTEYKDQEAILDIYRLMFLHPLPHYEKDMGSLELRVEKNENDSDHDKYKMMIDIIEEAFKEYKNAVNTEDVEDEEGNKIEKPPHIWYTTPSGVPTHTWTHQSIMINICMFIRKNVFTSNMFTNGTQLDGTKGVMEKDNRTPPSGDESLGDGCTKNYYHYGEGDNDYGIEIFDDELRKIEDGSRRSRQKWYVCKNLTPSQSDITLPQLYNQKNVRSKINVFDFLRDMQQELDRVLYPNHWDGSWDKGTPEDKKFPGGNLRILTFANMKTRKIGEGDFEEGVFLRDQRITYPTLSAYPVRNRIVYMKTARPPAWQQEIKDLQQFKVKQEFVFDPFFNKNIMEYWPDTVDAADERAPNLQPYIDDRHEGEGAAVHLVTQRRAHNMGNIRVYRDIIIYHHKRQIDKFKKEIKQLFKQKLYYYEPGTELIWADMFKDVHKLGNDPEISQILRELYQSDRFEVPIPAAT